MAHDQEDRKLVTFQAIVRSLIASTQRVVELERMGTKKVRSLFNETDQKRSELTLCALTIHLASNRQSDRLQRFELCQ